MTSLKDIIHNLEEYFAMGESVEATQIPKPQYVLQDTLKNLKAFEKTLHEYLRINAYTTTMVRNIGQKKGDLWIEVHNLRRRFWGKPKNE